VSRYHRFRWVPFYLLVPLAGALLFLDDDIPMCQTLRAVLLGAIVILICALAVLWIERNPRIVESEGVDSLRGHYLLEGMTPHWPGPDQDPAPEDDDFQFMPVRHSGTDH
jgi:hypothetical protein